MAVNWLAKIVDGASGPLRNIAAAARAAQNAMRALNAEGASKLVADVEKLAKAEVAVNAALAKQVGLRKRIATPVPTPAAASPANANGKGAIGGLSAVISGGGIGGALDAALGTTAIAPFLGIVSSIFSAEVAIAEKAVEIAASLTLSGSELAIQATSARNMAVDVFTNITKSKSAAEGAYDGAIRLSEKLGTTPEVVLGRMKKFLSAGLKPADVAPAIEAIENATVGISQKAGMALDRSITKIAAKGFMDNRALTQLAGAGINVQHIYEALAKKMGKSVKDVEMLTRKGKVNATDALAAIEEVVNAQSGGLAAKRGGSIPGLFSAIGTEFKNFFSKVDVAPVQGFLSNVLKAMQGPGGKAVMGSIQDFFGSVFHTLFDPFKGAEGQKRLERLLFDISNALNNATGFIKAAKPYIGWLVKMLTSKGSGKGSSLADDIHEISKAALDLIGVATGFGPLGEFLDMFQDYEFDSSVFTDALDSVSDFIDEFSELGTNLIDGLVGGITDNASAVADAVMNAVSGAISAAKSALGIASPSTVFAGIGEFTAQGFAEGMGSSDEPSRAADRMARAPIAAAQAAVAPSILNGKGGARGAHVDVGGINVNVHGGDAKDIRQNVGRELRAELEGWALELGAAPAGP